MEQPDTINIDDVTITTKGYAEEVLASLRALIRQHQVARVSDFYALTGIKGSLWWYEGWGWDDLSNASIRPERDGYVVGLPRPKKIT